MLAAFDLSLSGSGVAWGGPESGSPQTGLWRLPKGEHELDRALHILRDNARNLFQLHGVTDVAVEAVMLKVGRQYSAYTLFSLASVGAVVREAAYSAGARVSVVDVRTWRKTCFGNGNLVRDEAKAAAERFCKRFGWDHYDENVCEASCLWYHAMALRYPRWRPGRKAA